MRFLDKLFKKEEFLEEDYATADESLLIGDDF
jgi:hypothetical protein